LITGTRYQIEKLRCSLCEKIFTADLPESIAKQPKYDVTVKSTLAMGRYQFGLTMKRTESWQQFQRVPMPDATQWKLLNELYSDISFMFPVLERYSAEASLILYDDTPNRIILKQSDKRKGVFTTAFVAEYCGHKIHLFYTGQRYAGENMELLLNERKTDEKFMSMSDASVQNIPKRLQKKVLMQWIICLCLVHGRRKFHEIASLFETECGFVLAQIAKIYLNEKHCKTQGLNAEERLAYHQKHSAPEMQALYIWLNNQLLYQKIEPNSGLGQAIFYMLKYQDKLTRFLTVAGAPLDNNICEQAIKMIIRHRKNSLFYRTAHGAEVGDALSSIIYTAAAANVNVFEYLNALQIYKTQARASPDDWLPWNYQATLNQIRLAA
jgi:transposase